MEANLAFHAILERKVTELGFGQLDVTVLIKEGQVVVPTINILKSKRTKYKDGTRTTKLE